MYDQLALEDALQEAVAVLEGDEGGVLLRSEAVDSAVDLDAGSLGRLVAELDRLVVELDPDGGGERLVLLDDHLLGLLEVLESLLSLQLLLLSRLLLLGQLLLIDVDTALSLLDGRFRGLLPGSPIGRALSGRGADQVFGLGGAVEVLEEGMVQALEGLLEGAVGGGGVDASLGVDVDAGVALDALGERSGGIGHNDSSWIRCGGMVCGCRGRDSRFG